MSSTSSVARSPVRFWVLRIHRWLGVGAALIWLLQAATGFLLSFHFEIEDAMLSPDGPPTDLAAIERRMDELGSAGTNARVIWIWTTAGLPDRYVINFDDGDGADHRARINGAGEVLRDRRANDYSFLTFAREIHLTLVAGAVGQWILATAGILLATNLILGLVVAWPRRAPWRSALTPKRGADSVATIFSCHRAFGLWIAIPAIFVVGTGSLILLEHPLEDLVGATDVSLPANPPDGPGVGFAAMATAAVDAIPGSHFVGTTMPSADDASYYAWVHAPGELYREGGYGGSLVIVDANDGSVRGAYPATEHNAAKAFVYSFYPLHTGEAAGIVGRVLVMLVGMWLTTVIALGILLWFRRRRQSTQTFGQTSDRRREPVGQPGN